MQMKPKPPIANPEAPIAKHYGLGDGFPDSAETGSFGVTGSTSKGHKGRDVELEAAERREQTNLATKGSLKARDKKKVNRQKAVATAKANALEGGNPLRFQQDVVKAADAILDPKDRIKNVYALGRLFAKSKPKLR